MACICCFFDNKHQKKIKKSCFGISNFKDKLNRYKLIYLEEMSQLIPVNKCTCEFSKDYKDNSVFIDFANDMLFDFQSKSSWISEIFDSLIVLYTASFDLNCKINLDSQVGTFLDKFCTNYSSINDIQMCHILFRGREEGSYDDANINEFFHLPFSMLGNTSEQRFSSKGSIMFYLARALPITAAELGKDISKLKCAMFFPKYSWVYQKGMFDFTNSIDKTINDAIPALIKGGSIIEYDNDTFTFSRKNLSKILGDSILFQVLSFPVEVRKDICDEYILPHLFTENIRHRGNYLGVVYQSTKDNNLTENKFSELDYNYCFFVPSNEENGQYNEQLLDCFHTVCIGECTSGKSYFDLQKQLSSLDVALKQKSHSYIMSDYALVYADIESYILQMERVITEDKKYYNTIYGKIEIALLCNFIDSIIEIVMNPKKHGIIQYAPLE